MINSEKQYNKAIIIGASISGLLAAKVCSKHFSNVIIVEKDDLSDCIEHRKGVPQSKQLHILLAKGLDNIEKLFPGISKKLINNGAIEGDIGLHLKWYSRGGFRPQCETGLKTLMLSRPLLENTIRKELLNLNNVELISSVNIKGFQWKNNHVVGISTESNKIMSDLVVDARGVNSQLSDNIIMQGYPVPTIEKVKVNVKYTSLEFPRSKYFNTLLNVNSTPPFNTKHGTIQPIEDNKMLVMLQGRKFDNIPKNSTEFKEYAQALESSVIYDGIHNLNPLTKISKYNVPYVRWIHYEKMKRFPQGVLPLGDSICRLNPVYGQGMTSASIQAMILDDVLSKKSIKNLWKYYLPKIAKAIKSPWELTLAEDFKFPETEGVAPYVPSIMEKYFNKLNKVMNHDTFIYKHFMQVLNMESGPLILLKPKIIWKVIKASNN